MHSPVIPEPLSERSRRLGLNVLLFDTFLMWGGFFLVVPLIGVYFVDDLGWAAASVGLVLAVRQFLQQGVTVFGGALSDRFGARGLILAGLFVRVLGFGLLSFATSFPMLMLASVLSGLGGALFDAPGSAAAAALTTPESRARFFSLRGTVGSLGMTVGPLVGALLIRSSFQVVALVSATCYMVTFFVTAWLLPPVRTSSEAPAGSSLFSGLLIPLRDRRFVAFTALLVGMWFLWSHLGIAVSLFAVKLSGSRDAISWVYTTQSVLSIALQIPVMRFLQRFLSGTVTLALGIALMAFGLGGLVFVSSITGLLVCVAVFALGGLIASPVQQTMVARMADPRALGSYFGVNALALAFGGGVGSYVAGILYDLGKGDLAWLPWSTAFLAGLLSAAGLVFWRAWFEHEPRDEPVKPL